MKFATAIAVVLASALSALAHAEIAVNEAPARSLALHGATTAPIQSGTGLPVLEEIVVRADAEKIDVVDHLTMDKETRKLGQQLAQRLQHDLVGLN